MFNRYKLQNRHLAGYNPRDVGRHDGNKTHAFGPAVRNYWLLHYVFEGNVTFQKGEKTYEVTKGQCFIIRPEEITYYRANPPWYYVWMGFSADDVPSCLKSNDVLDVPFLECVFSEIESNIDKYNGAFGNEGVREAYLCGKISEAMALLELHYSQPKESPAESEMNKVKNYIDVRLSSALSVSDIATEFHLDRAHLSRKFKEVIGMSPQNYIVNARLREAAKLMK
ncbi:MAG: AraC family transcriptional regulator, partial [Clostridia bacterium]|nr:AraC family transcriptional regulator [Clostridia bacterium]